MGINISVVKIISKTTEKLWNDQEVQYYITEDIEWWDSLRHNGDNEFVLQNEFIAIDTDNSVEDREYFRPSDFKKTIKWVGQHVQIQGNRERLIMALLKMEEDESICFTWSW